MKILQEKKDQKVIKKIMAKRRSFAIEDEINQVVKEIIDQVKQQGDKALREFTYRFDDVKLKDLQVSEAEIDRACNEVDDDFLLSLKKSISAVRDFHQRQLKNSWFNHQDGKMVGQLLNPLAKVGAYVPGGLAAYPSSLVMTVVPARVAGVEEVVVTTPPDENGQINSHILAAARESGVDSIYKLGGAQAIAALAVGTETISQVDKIVGPGNIYVTAAKKMVFGQVDIDMLAGPSELLILADDSANPDYLAADLLSQAEHDMRAIPVLITTSSSIASQTEKAVREQLKTLAKRELAEKSWDDNGIIIIASQLESGLKMVNDFAPEHFELVVKEPFAYLDMVKNAGAIFIGQYSSEPVGDYIAGPNHVLPTGGTARFASPLNTDDFFKKSSIIYYRKDSFEKIREDVHLLASMEGLDGHARAVQIRKNGVK